MAHPTTLLPALLGGTLISLIPASALAQSPLRVEPYRGDTVNEGGPIDDRDSLTRDGDNEGRTDIGVPLTPPPSFRKRQSIVPQRRLPRSLHVDTVEVITR
ncbi:MAG: hypothetical protein CBB79_10835 [Synechococcus sp. TMED19]|nr:MAG: hypothetical protein CBB79_10835 [Synechococcus sp. TMED19]